MMIDNSGRLAAVVVPDTPLTAPIVLAVAVGPVPEAPANTVAPAVTGTALVGQTLTCSTGTWSHTPTGFAYQWTRDGAAIGGATASTRLLAMADAYHVIGCTVTASNAAGSASADSNAVEPELDPAAMFAGTERGFVFDFTDPATLFQNSGGTGAVAAPGDPIGYATDLSGNGNHATRTTAGQRPLWSADGAVADGTKYMDAPAVDFTNTDQVTVIVCAKVPAGGNHPAIGFGGTAAGNFYLSLLSSQGNIWTSSLYGSTGQSVSVNGRGVPGANFQVISAVMDLAQALAADESIVRVNGEAFGTGSGAGPAGAGPFANAASTLFLAFFGAASMTMARIIVIDGLLGADELFAAERWAGEGGGLELISELPPAGNVHYSLIDSYGQSLSVGAYGTPLLSTAARFNDKMLAGGVLTPLTDPASLVDLVEAEATISGTPCGETPVSGMVEMLHELGYADPFIGAASGFPASPIADLSQGISIYNFMMDVVEAAWRRSREEFQHFKVRAVPWMQGESDATNPAYVAELQELADDLDADIRAITLQSDPVWLLSYQLDHAKTGLEHLAAADGSDKIRVAMPMYFIEHYLDGVHLTAEGSKISGAYFGLAYKALFVDGDAAWQPLRIQSHARSGSHVDVVYNPVGALTFDTTLVAAQANRGFRLFQGDGTTPITISSVALVGSDTVRITASGTIPADAVLRVGFDDPTETAGGTIVTNVRDNQGDTIVFDGGGLDYPMHNWAVGEQRVVA